MNCSAARLHRSLSYFRWVVLLTVLASVGGRRSHRGAEREHLGNNAPIPRCVHARGSWYDPPAHRTQKRDRIRQRRSGDSERIRTSRNHAWKRRPPLAWKSAHRQDGARIVHAIQRLRLDLLRCTVLTRRETRRAGSFCNGVAARKRRMEARAEFQRRSNARTER